MLGDTSPFWHIAMPLSGGIHTIKAALDRFILVGGVKATDAHVHRSLKSRRASDHLPIVLNFEIAGERAQC